MKNFKEFIDLQEVLLTFGKSQRPKFGNVVIMAGGAGSGKGFVNDNLVGIQGKILDVDILKTMALKSKMFHDRVKKEFGIELADLKLKNPKDVSVLHKIVDELGLADRKNSALFKSIMATPHERKPNIIFDMTMSSLTKLINTSADVVALGYEKKNIHIVWVVNELDTALQQNKERNRMVPNDILTDTHNHVSLTMKNILSGGSPLRKYMDGEFYVVFNKKYVDSLLSFSDAGGSYVKDTFYVRIKKPGKSILKLSDISDDVINKIKTYVPDASIWEK